MSKLERWLPFKFRRKDKESEQKREETLAPSASPGASLTAFHSPLLSTPMNQMIQSFFNDPFFRDPMSRLSEMDRWFGDFTPARFSPNVEVVDEETALKVTAELPGLSQDDINIQIDDGALVISGEKKNSEESRENGVYRTERYYGYFQRAIPLPDDVDRDRTEAELREGVLTVRLPKLPEGKHKSKRISIKGA